jgi:hypothetical protein
MQVLMKVTPVMPANTSRHLHKQKQTSAKGGILRFSFFFFKILSFLLLLTCVYITQVTSPSLPYPLLLGTTCSALLFSDFIEEKI